MTRKVLFLTEPNPTDTSFNKITSVDRQAQRIHYEVRACHLVGKYMSYQNVYVVVAALNIGAQSAFSKKGIPFVSSEHYFKESGLREIDGQCNK